MAFLHAYDTAHKVTTISVYFTCDNDFCIAEIQSFALVILVSTICCTISSSTRAQTHLAREHSSAWRQESGQPQSGQLIESAIFLCCVNHQRKTLSFEGTLVPHNFVHCFSEDNVSDEPALWYSHPSRVIFVFINIL